MQGFMAYVSTSAGKKVLVLLSGVVALIVTLVQGLVFHTEPTLGMIGYPAVFFGTIITMIGEEGKEKLAWKASWSIFGVTLFFFALSLPLGSLIEGLAYGELEAGDPRMHTIAVPIVALPFVFLVSTGVCAMMAGWGILGKKMGLL